MFVLKVACTYSKRCDDLFTESVNLGANVLHVSIFVRPLQLIILPPFAIMKCLIQSSLRMNR